MNQADIFINQMLKEHVMTRLNKRPVKVINENCIKCIMQLGDCEATEWQMLGADSCELMELQVNGIYGCDFFSLISSYPMEGSPNHPRRLQKYRR